MPHYQVRTKNGSIDLDTHDLAEATACWQRLPNGAKVMEYTERDGWVKVDPTRPARLEPNRALARAKLETLAWEQTPEGRRGRSGSRREVLLDTTDGTGMVPLGELTDFQLRRYIGPGRLEEAGDMRKNGRGIYSGTAAKANRGLRRNARRPQSSLGLHEDHELMQQLVEMAAESMELPNYKDADRSAQADETAARKLSLYIENEYSLVGAPNSQGKAIEKNLLGHMRRGNFDIKKAEIAYMLLMETGAKKYAKEFADGKDWSKIFNKPTLELVAHEFATSFAEEHGARELAPNARIRECTKAYIRTYSDTDQITAYVEGIGTDGKTFRTEGDPDNTHIQALLARCKREGIPVKKETW
jgi:hypothetical protein